MSHHLTRRPISRRETALGCPSTERPIRLHARLTQLSGRLQRQPTKEVHMPTLVSPSGATRRVSFASRLYAITTLYVAVAMALMGPLCSQRAFSADKAIPPPSEALERVFLDTSSGQLHSDQLRDRASGRRHGQRPP